MKDLDRLQKIYEKTDGHCHLCHKKITFSNHGKRGCKGAWHIEHSKAKANGGTDHLNNLFPACIVCNIDKGVKHTKTIRKQNGVSRAPYNRQKKEVIKKNNTTAGVLVGTGIGLAFGGPAGAFLGGIIGGAIGESNSPKK